MSTAVVCTSFREWAWVRALERQVKKAGMEFIHTPAASSWHGDEQDVMGQVSCPNEADQRNFALGRAWMKGYAWAITLDADEVFSIEDFRLLQWFLTTVGSDKSVILAGQMNTYFKGPEWRVTPRETHCPVIAVRGPLEPFRDGRCVQPGIGLERWDGGVLEHFSWARPEAEILTKLKTFGHALQVRPGWYEDVWQRWTPSSRNFHPLGDGAGYQGVCASEAPEEILEHWRRAAIVNIRQPDSKLKEETA